MIGSVIRNIPLCTLALALAACTLRPAPHPEKPEAYYWQRVSASSPLLLQGPKAQQMLDEDIAVCDSELYELERLGAISVRRSAPEAESGYRSDTGMERTRRFEEVVRAVHLPYHDLNGCMAYKGWERVDDIPYSLAEEDQEEYADRIIRQRYRTRTLQRPESTY